MNYLFQNVGQILIQGVVFLYASAVLPVEYFGKFRVDYGYIMMFAVCFNFGYNQIKVKYNSDFELTAGQFALLPSSLLIVLLIFIFSTRQFRPFIVIIGYLLALSNYIWVDYLVEKKISKFLWSQLFTRTVIFISLLLAILIRNIYQINYEIITIVLLLFYMSLFVKVSGYLPRLFPLRKAPLKKMALPMYLAILTVLSGNIEFFAVEFGSSEELSFQAFISIFIAGGVAVLSMFQNKALEIFLTSREVKLQLIKTALMALLTAIIVSLAIYISVSVIVRYTPYELNIDNDRVLILNLFKYLSYASYSILGAMTYYVLSLRWTLFVSSTPLLILVVARELNLDLISFIKFNISSNILITIIILCKFLSLTSGEMPKRLT